MRTSAIMKRHSSGFTAKTAQGGSLLALMYPNSAKNANVLKVVPQAAGAWLGAVSRARCGILDAASQNRDRYGHPTPLRPRLCSAPRREERRAALRPGNGVP